MSNRFAPGEGAENFGYPEAPPDDWPQEWAHARDVLYDANPGDKVIWGDRKTPLVVTNTDFGENERFIHVRGPRGGEYTIREEYTPNGGLALSTDSGESVNDLEFEEREEIDQKPDAAKADDGGGSMDITHPEENDGGQADDGDDVSGVIAEDGREFGHHWPESEGESKDADEFVAELTDDPFATYDDFVEEVGGDKPASRGLMDNILGREDPTWTFVDELQAFGQDVPKAVNNWILVDFGVVKPGSTDRQAAWYNRNSEEMVILHADGGNGGAVDWSVYHADDAADPDEDEITANVVTQDPNEAMSLVYDILDVSTSPDIEIVEKADGSVEVIDNIDNAELGRMVLSRFAGTLPSLPREQRVFGTIGRGADAGLAWTQDNIGVIGQTVKWSLVYGVVGLSKRFLGVRVQPLIRSEEVGVRVQYRYEGEGANWLEAMGGGKLTVDPQKFNLNQGSKWALGVNYDQAQYAASLLGIDEIEVSPGDAISVPTADDGGGGDRSSSSSSSTSSSRTSRQSVSGSAEDVAEAAVVGGSDGEETGEETTVGVWDAFKEMTSAAADDFDESGQSDSSGGGSDGSDDSGREASVMGDLSTIERNFAREIVGDALDRHKELERGEPDKGLTGEVYHPFFDEQDTGDVEKSDIPLDLVHDIVIEEYDDGFNPAGGSDDDSSPADRESDLDEDERQQIRDYATEKGAMAQKDRDKVEQIREGKPDKSEAPQADVGDFNEMWGAEMGRQGGQSQEPRHKDWDLAQYDEEFGEDQI